MDGKKIKIIPLVIISLLLSGCALSSGKPSFEHYFLCNSGQYSDGVLLLDRNGESVLELSDARLSSCTLQDGTILSQTAGEIPDNALLFIEFDGSGENPQGGVWSVKEQDWLVPPGEGPFAYISYEGVLETFYINGLSYGIDGRPQPSKSLEETFFHFSDDLVLHNQLDASGNYYIADESGECLLNGATFYEKNSSLLPDLTYDDSIFMTNSIMGKYMILEYNQITSSGDGRSIINTASFLCDLQGNVLYPEWGYDGVIFPSDQFGHTDRNYLSFFSPEGQLIHSLYLPTMQEISFPDGFTDAGYKSNGLFLLENQGKYTIYDSKTDSLGAAFTLDDYMAVFVLGPDSYVIQQINNNRIVIENVPQLCEEEIAVVSAGEYPVIKSGEIWGPYDTSYILDSDGHLRYKINADIICADSSHFLTETLHNYQIHTYP